MKKIYGILLAFMSLTLISSCDNGETYADKLKKERKAIKNFIAENNIKVIYDFPKHPYTFGENEFYYDTDSGIYFHVVDSGDGRRAEDKLKVFVRYRGAHSLITDPDSLSSNTAPSEVQDYLNFEYNVEQTYLGTLYDEDYTPSNYLFKSPGIVRPLNFVGNHAIIKLLVPFSAGSTVQLNSYEAVYFDFVYYDIKFE